MTQILSCEGNPQGCDVTKGKESCKHDGDMSEMAHTLLEWLKFYQQNNNNCENHRSKREIDRIECQNSN